ncbi:hypothetical protein [Oceanobacillus timonensis]|uniref:hypothetical protein n=1 Tax=Oceanobacillus timonensis TaxID=1926285 RepID=UPI0009BC5F3B|nr:hypothetical protein [Oceanobacillus timonensis]
MMKILQSILCGFGFVMIYVLIILCAPFILKMFSILGIPIHATIFGTGLFEMETNQGGFYSQLSLSGCILSFLTGIFFYYIFYPIKEQRKNRE